jgi:hypothetical protein
MGRAARVLRGRHIHLSATSGGRPSTTDELRIGSHPYSSTQGSRVQALLRHSRGNNAGSPEALPDRRPLMVAGA